jgi:predicted ester cyclase
MKLYYKVLPLFVFAVLFSCQPQVEETPKEDTAAVNRAFVENWFTALNSPNWKEEIKPYLSDEGFIELHAPYREAFPEYQASVLNVITEGNMVVTHIKVQASHQGEFPYDEFKGVEPSGTTAEWTEVMAFDVVDGKFGADPGFFFIDYKTRMEQFGIQCLPDEADGTE